MNAEQVQQLLIEARGKCDDFDRTIGQVVSGIYDEANDTIYAIRAIIGNVIGDATAKLRRMVSNLSSVQGKVVNRIAELTYDLSQSAISTVENIQNIIKNSGDLTGSANVGLMQPPSEYYGGCVPDQELEQCDGSVVTIPGNLPSPQCDNFRPRSIFIGKDPNSCPGSGDGKDNGDPIPIPGDGSGPGDGDGNGSCPAPVVNCGNPNINIDVNPTPVNVDIGDIKVTNTILDCEKYPVGLSDLDYDISKADSCALGRMVFDWRDNYYSKYDPTSESGLNTLATMRNTRGGVSVKEISELDPQTYSVKYFSKYNQDVADFLETMQSFVIGEWV